MHAACVSFCCSHENRSPLEVMITDYGLVEGGSFAAQLGSLYDLLWAYCKRTKTPLHMEALTRNQINFKRDSDYPTG